jgi:hypothetical protein
MCCFSKEVISVSATNIFARAGEDARQFLVYSMTIKAKEHLAMILPLPVKTPAEEKDVEFIDLKDYPNFFTDLHNGFPPPPRWAMGGVFKSGPIWSAGVPKLEVVGVGDFEASFVPSMKDFSRLDERFRLPTDAWNKLTDYQTYGFAVFKLKPGAMTIHPMAFSFPRRYLKALFFPTAHIHDGKVYPKAGFDHALYCQPRENQPLALDGWQESNSHASNFMQVSKTKGVIDANQHAYLREMHGSLPNQDTFLAMNG